jgi:hypothetical protein
MAADEGPADAQFNSGNAPARDDQGGGETQCVYDLLFNQSNGFVKNIPFADQNVK